MNHKSLFPAQISLLRFGTYPTGCPEAPQIQQVSTSHTSPLCPTPIFHHPGSLSQWMTSQGPSFPSQKAGRKPNPPSFLLSHTQSIISFINATSFQLLSSFKRGPPWSSLPSFPTSSHTLSCLPVHATLNHRERLLNVPVVLTLECRHTLLSAWNILPSPFVLPYSI